jgi:hypothetical protein
MYQPIQFKNTTTVPVRNSISRSPLRYGLFLITLACFSLLPTAQAQLPSPAPDGGYLNQNTAEGDGALFSLTTGENNTATGFQALYSNTTGLSNTASGDESLFYNNGNNNTATGFQALGANQTGGDNVANGFEALQNNTTGIDNTATGSGALQGVVNNSTGSFNTANGFQALFSNTTGSNNTANGFDALYNNTADNNTAYGSQALYSNTTGEGNTALGFQALFNNQAPTSNGNGQSANTAAGSLALYSTTTGIHNTAIGAVALYSNTTGSRNNATGLNALYSNTTGGHNDAYGNSTLTFNTTGGFNIGLGYGAGDNLTAGGNNVYISNLGVATESNTIRIGNPVATVVPDGSTQPAHTATFIAGIYGGTTAKGVSVVIDSSGHLGTKGSSERFKTEIKPMDKSSQAILALKPVTFRYKKELDPEGTPQFGLVAEEVAKVNPDLVVRDEKGEIYTVRYDAVNAMLLNEFLKEHRTVQEQQKEIDALKSELKEQRALIQKVNDKVEINKPAPQTVLNNQ